MRRLVLLLCLDLAAVWVWPLPPEVERARILTRAIYETYKYEASPMVVKSPGQMLLDKTADCADGAMLLITYLALEGMQSEMYRMLLVKENRTHAVVRMGLYYFDTTNGRYYVNVYPRPHIELPYLPSELLLADWTK